MRLRLLQEIQGCGITGAQLFSAKDGTVQILKDGWKLTASAMWYNDVSSNGGKPFAGPMLVLQGTEDPNAIEAVTSKGVKRTCELFPDSQLEYIVWVSSQVYLSRFLRADQSLDNRKISRTFQCCMRANICGSIGYTIALPE